MQHCPQYQACQCVWNGLSILAYRYFALPMPYLDYIRMRNLLRSARMNIFYMNCLLLKRAGLCGIPRDRPGFHIYEY
ncbi:hypothetical protein EJ02DRAFT_452512 [Clathrospora elynae]|uniref:Uncharacterized protein n=1 Tax=Clathrospora elynae TaxID=706981 RepID=A0A6A5SWX7_9PLEO|nr:hypothetical protein EJ02DRAFT_452512 [Clathrospora elynae]